MSPPRKKALSLIEKYGAEYIEEVGVYTPAGTIWCATDCHTIGLGRIVNAREYWLLILGEVEQGVYRCDITDCEICSPELSPL